MITGIIDAYIVTFTLQALPQAMVDVARPTNNPQGISGTNVNTSCKHVLLFVFHLSNVLTISNFTSCKLMLMRNYEERNMQILVTLRSLHMYYT